MLLPMLGRFLIAATSRAAISSRRTKDWKSWTPPFGYEGYLGDNYYALPAVLAREVTDARRVIQHCGTWVNANLP